KAIERLKAAAALRRFGIEVTIQVGPVLPCGDWRADAAEFATLLAENADYINLFPLTDGSEKTDRRIRGTPLARKLAQDRKFHWLRRDSAEPLRDAIARIAPEKLVEPRRSQLEEKQLKIFAT